MCSYAFDNNIEGRRRVALNEKLDCPTLESLDITELSQDADLDAILAVAQRPTVGLMLIWYTPSASVR